ncbi:MAG: glycosyltransferase [Thermodesulfovibrionia bacterium]
MGIEGFNILHVVSRLPIGGVENMLFKVIESYNKERFNPIVCCIKEGGVIADKIRDAGYKVWVLNRMRRHGFDINAVIELYRLIKREDIHILRTHQYHANLYGRLAGILAGVPVIIPSFHSRYMSPERPKLHRRLLNHILSRSSYKLVAVSDAVAGDMIRFDRVKPEKVIVINNGVALDRFNINLTKEEARRRLNLSNSGMIIGTVGRLREEKGQRFLIEAMSVMNNVTLALAGYGPLMVELKRLSEELKVNCIFMGEIMPDDIPLFLKSLDIFCFPSLWEGFSTALVEAMASGLPIIASDNPSHREVLGDAGVFVPSRDSNAIRGAIRMLIDDPFMRDELSKKAKERANLFSIERTVNAYEELFEDGLQKCNSEKFLPF